MTPHPCLNYYPAYHLGSTPFPAWMINYMVTLEISTYSIQPDDRHMETLSACSGNDIILVLLKKVNHCSQKVKSTKPNTFIREYRFTFYSASQHFQTSWQLLIALSPTNSPLGRETPALLSSLNTQVAQTTDLIGRLAKITSTFSQPPVRPFPDTHIHGDCGSSRARGGCEPPKAAPDSSAWRGSVSIIFSSKCKTQTKNHNPFLLCHFIWQKA